MTVVSPWNPSTEGLTEPRRELGRQSRYVHGEPAKQLIGTRTEYGTRGNFTKWLADPALVKEFVWWPLDNLPGDWPQYVRMYSVVYVQYTRGTRASVIRKLHVCTPYSVRNTLYHLYSMYMLYSVQAWTGRTDPSNEPLRKLSRSRSLFETHVSSIKRALRGVTILLREASCYWSKPLSSKIL